MADVIMPQMGESIAEGTITKWMKNVGDKIVRDEPLFEISTDKVDAEIPAPASGYLQEIRVPPGTTVPINTVVAIIQEGDAPAATPEPPAISLVPPAPIPPPLPAPAAPPLPPLVPLADTAPPPVVTAPAPPPAPPPEPVVLAPAVAPAPPPPPAPPTAITMTPPAPLASPEPGRPTPPPAASAPPSVPVRPAEPAAPPPRVPAEATAPPAAPAAPSEKPRSEMTVDELRRSRSSPVVRNIAAEHNVDISQVPGTGVSGRVTKQDILTHLESRPGGSAPSAAGSSPAAEPPVVPAPAAAPIPATPAVPAYHPGERVQVIPMSPIRKKTAEHMVLSKRVSAHVSTVFEVDMSRLAHLRHKYRSAYEERSGIKLTYTPFILKATVDALKAFPVLNSSVDGDAIVYKKDINLGIAVALDWGLIVPVIRNADEKNVLGLARAVSDLADRARTKKLKVEEIQGGTFTVTNPGVFGSLFGTPIINQPQVGILGVGTIEKRPVVRDDAIAIRTMAYLALTFDHRIVDGADADRFMAHLKKGLQEFDESAM